MSTEVGIFIKAVPFSPPPRILFSPFNHNLCLARTHSFDWFLAYVLPTSKLDNGIGLLGSRDNSLMLSPACLTYPPDYLNFAPVRSANIYFIEAPGNSYFAACRAVCLFNSRYTVCKTHDFTNT